MAGFKLDYDRMSRFESMPKAEQQEAWEELTDEQQQAIIDYMPKYRAEKAARSAPTDQDWGDAGAGGPGRRTREQVTGVLAKMPKQDEIKRMNRDSRDIFATDPNVKPGTALGRYWEDVKDIGKSAGSAGVLAAHGATLGLVPKVAGAVAGLARSPSDRPPGTDMFDEDAYETTRDIFQDVVDSARKRKGSFAGANEFLGGLATGKALPGLPNSAPIVQHALVGGLKGGAMGGAAAYGYSEHDPVTEGWTPELTDEMLLGALINAPLGAAGEVGRAKIGQFGEDVLEDETTAWKKKVAQNDISSEQARTPREGFAKMDVDVENMQRKVDPPVTERVTPKAKALAEESTGFKAGLKGALASPYRALTGQSVDPAVTRSAARLASGLSGGTPGGLAVRSGRSIQEQGRSENLPGGTRDQGPSDGGSLEMGYLRGPGVDRRMTRSEAEKALRGSDAGSYTFTPEER